MPDIARFWGSKAQKIPTLKSWRLLSSGEKEMQIGIFYSTVDLLMEPFRWFYFFLFFIFIIITWFFWSFAEGSLEGFLEEIEPNLDLEA